MRSRTAAVPLALGMAGALLTLANPASAAGSVTVSSDADSGDGSLRAALTSGASTIVVTVPEITIASSLVYEAKTNLIIEGNGVTIQGNGLGEVLFQSTGGADVSIENATFDDGGDYSVSDGGGHGLHFATTDGQSGRMAVNLDNVHINGVGGHGIYVDDNREAPASVSLTLTDVTVNKAGIGGFDQDGVRVDETGDGDILFRAYNSTFSRNGADGIELDERGAGDVDFGVTKSAMRSNGDYCLGQDVESPLDPLCVDEGELDLDDGFDIDEADAGSVRGYVTTSTVSSNYDEGLDFDEAGDGGFEVTVMDVTANGNTDENIKVSEEDAGSVWISLADVTAQQGKNDAMALEEAGAGDLRAFLVDVQAMGVDGVGLVAEQLDKGAGVLMTTDSDLGEVKLDGVKRS